MRSRLILLLLTAAVLIPLSVNAAGSVQKRETKTSKSDYTQLDLTRGQKRKLKELHKSMKYRNEEHWRRTAALEIKIRNELLKSNTSSSRLSKYYSKLDALKEKNANLVAAHEKRAEKVMGEKYVPQFGTSEARKHAGRTTKTRRVPPSIHVRKLGAMNWGHFPEDGSPIFLRGYHHPGLIKKK
ncbi:MAG: hypothetical protein ACLFQB_12625 [Chitinispirillaceae bacterium]